MSFCSFSAKEKCFQFETGHFYFCFAELFVLTRVDRAVAGFTLAQVGEKCIFYDCFNSNFFFMAQLSIALLNLTLSSPLTYHRRSSSILYMERLLVAQFNWLIEFQFNYPYTTCIWIKCRRQMQNVGISLE